jgi:hypothetical protein
MLTGPEAVLNDILTSVREEGAYEVESSSPRAAERMRGHRMAAGALNPAGRWQTRALRRSRRYTTSLREVLRVG